MSCQTLQLITSHRSASFSVADRVDVAVGPLAVRTRRLAGGRRDGVLVVELKAGATSVFILPDRGLGIWKMIAGDVELGWQSPVQGPVHPRFVPLGEPSGIGWLDGFDELVARCGLVSNGAPDFDALRAAARGDANVVPFTSSNACTHSPATVTASPPGTRTRTDCSSIDSTRQRSVSPVRRINREPNQSGAV